MLIKYFLFLFVIIFVLHGHGQFSSEAYKIQTQDNVLEYLKHYGYLGDGEAEPLTYEDFKNALKDFQEDSNLTPNGILNAKTLRLMNTPRCGNRDEKIEEGDEVPDNEAGIIGDGDRNKRRKREAKGFIIPHGKKWLNSTLTYKIAKFPTRSSVKLNVRTVQSEFDHAFAYWEKVTNLRFKKVTGNNADIVIKFVRGYHGDRESFDGPGKALAHGFYPERGAIHFDDEEMWSAGFRKRHYDLRSIAVHEIGHALGLGHSKHSSAVMYHSYEGHRWRSHDNFKLHPEDIQAVQALYGQKGTRAGSEMTKDEKKKLRHSKKGTTGDLCVDPHIDAITTMDDGFIYIFKGIYFFRLDRLHGDLQGDQFQLINSTFLGLPSELDAAITMSNQKTYFFKGSLYWRSTSTQIDPGYPKQISDYFKKIPDSIDAAGMWSWNNEPYFFKGDKYWKYSEKVKEMRNYPNPISKYWPGIPNSIDAAFRAPDNRTYFIKGGKYWLFHDPNSEYEATAFPKSTKNWLFRCPNNEVRRVRKIRHRKKKHFPG
ncbi:unnamed protein product [Allacma fusca]|uniref:Peptidase metallopeptidase domain-containing protein n=1 Tax=Allacma fusca TaxID=39272 RepID=A0A8J2L6P5_9HEXA|nr:unnamed protein product [Allacma fusca]